MEIKKSAVVGTLESSEIRRVIEETLKELGVTSVEVIAVDKGALDCTIQARTVTVVHRAAEVENYDWKEIDSWNA